MRTNRLVEGTGTIRRSAHEWCAVGNMHLASIGRAHEVEWRVVDGRPEICWRRG